MLGWESPDLSGVSSENLAQWIFSESGAAPITGGIGKTATGSVRARNVSRPMAIAI